MSYEPNFHRNAEIRRRRLSGVGPREIARQMNLSVNVVAGVLHRADMTTELRGRGAGLPPAMAEALLCAQRGVVGETADAMGIERKRAYRFRFRRRRDAA